MRFGTIATITIALLGAAGCARIAPPVVAASAQSPSVALAALFEASDEGNLQRNPLSGLSRGDLRYADRYGDYLSEAYYDAERQAAEQELAALARIDRNALKASERISYDVFKYQRALDQRGLQPDMLALTAVRPLDHFNGIHTGFAEISAGDSIAPFKTVKDYDNGLGRIDDFVAVMDRSIVRMREGMASNVVQPRLVMDNVVEQLDAMIAQGVEGSSFMKPLNAFPSDIPALERARLTAAYTQAIATKLRPALVRVRSFIASEYLPRTRASVGLGAMPGGDKLYAYLVQSSTTTDLSADAIHRIGLSEVARLHAEMETVKTQVGFAGTLKQFFDHIRTDPKFKPVSRAALQQGYVAIGKRLDATLPKLFATLPRTALEIRPVPALTEKGAARGSYNSGDGGRVAARGVLFQRLRPAVAHDSGNGDAVPPRRRAGASFPDHFGAGE